MTVGTARREQEIPIVTVNTNDDRQHFPMPGVPSKHFTNLGAGKKWDGWRTKILMYQDWLEAKVHREPDKIVILLDSGDVLFGGCTDDELRSMYDATVSVSGGAPVVMGAELYLWPFTLVLLEKYATRSLQTRREAVQQVLGLDDNSYGRYANVTLCSEFPRSSRCSTPNAYQFLNAGFIMGPVKAIHKVLAGMLDTRDTWSGMSPAWWKAKHNVTDGWDDQGAAAEWMLSHADDVTLDYTGALSIQLSKMKDPLRNKVLFLKDGVVRNRVTGRVQCFVHGNGLSEEDLPQLLKQLGGSEQVDAGII